MFGWIKKLKFWQKESEVGVDALVMPQPKKFRLTIYSQNKIVESFESTDDIRYLAKVYIWYLIRESPKYNFKYDVGQVILLRSEITKMRLVKLSA